jgi:hypothetical protein
MWALAKKRRPLIVAAGGGLADSLLTPNASKLTFEARIPFVLGADVAELWPVFDGKYVDGGTNAEINIPTAISLTKVAIEIGAVVRPVKFSGSRSKTIAIGAVRQHADPIRAREFGLTRLLRNTTVWVRLYGTVPSSAGRYPQNCYCGITGAKFAVFTSGTDRTDTTGALPAQTSEDIDSFGYGPTALLGRTVGKARPAVIGFGSSTMAGTGDANYVTSGPGLLNRALFDGAGGNAIAGIACGVNGGATLNEFISSSGWRREYFRYATHFLDQHHNSGQTPVSAQVDKSRQVWKWARDRGCTKIIRVLYQPDTTSSDGWTTLAGQTANANGDWAEDFHDELLPLVGSEIQGLVTWNGVRGSTDSSNANWKKWKPNPNGGVALTGDGLHGNEQAYRINGAEARALILSS